MPTPTDAVDRSELAVLVIDDIKSHAAALDRNLRSNGFRASYCLSGTEGLTKFRDYDVILLDLNLDEESGLEVSEQILEAQPQKWVFHMSAHENLLEQSRHTSPAPLGQLAKPMNDEEERKLQYTLDELAHKKAKRAHLIALASERLQVAIASCELDPIAAQVALSGAKDVISEELLPTTRKRRTNNPSPRRAITVAIWSCMSRLSFVPSKYFNLVQPTLGQLEALHGAISVLGKTGLTEDDRRAVDRLLRAAGLQMSLSEAPATRPDLGLDVDPDMPGDFDDDVSMT